MNSSWSISTYLCTCLTPSGIASREFTANLEFKSKYIRHATENVAHAEHQMAYTPLQCYMNCLKKAVTWWSRRQRNNACISSQIFSTFLSSCGHRYGQLLYPNVQTSGADRM